MYSFQSELFKNKLLRHSIKSIYGLNKYYTRIVEKKLGFSCNLKTFYITSNQILKLVYFIENIPTLKENSLKKYNFSVFQQFLEIKIIKFKRILNGLPVRGQRTHTNSKTAKKKLFLK